MQGVADRPVERRIGPDRGLQRGHRNLGLDRHAQGSEHLATRRAGRGGADQLLVATGRAARLEGLGLETIGLDPTQRYLQTDDRMRAGDNVWGVGDVTGNGNFTHMAMYEADVAVRDILGQGGPAADYRARPRVTFIDPEIGAVGMTEKQARDAGIDVQVGFVKGPHTSRGFIHGPGNDGFIKVIA